ncbi:MAG: hypothetical protein Fur0043_12820 [Anaerolineales bacterium]
MDQDLALINEKLDNLLAQLEAQRKQQEGMDELMRDAIPIVNHMIKLSIDELAEVGNDFELGDLLFLLKRLLRDTRLLFGLLDQVESLAELAEEGQRMGKRVFNQVVEQLDRLEREGYFGAARAGWNVAGQAVKQFRPEEIEAAGARMIAALKEPPPEKVSLLTLLRALGDPKVRRGLYRTLNVLRAIGE